MSGTSTGPVTPSASASAMSRGEVLVVLAGVMLALLATGLDQTTVAVAGLTIVEDFGLGVAALGGLFTVNLLAAAAAAPIFGKLSDLYGRRRLFLVATGFFVVGSLICGLAPAFGILVAGRGIQGIGSGGLTAMAIIVVADMVTSRARASYQGYIGAELAVASVVGPWLGGVLADQASWRWVFLINIPLGLAAMVIVGLRLRSPAPGIRRSIDWLGAVLLVLGLLALIVMFLLASMAPLTSPPILALAVVAAGFVVAFVLVERRAREPIVPLRLFRSRVVTTALILMLLAGAGIFAVQFYLPAVLQIVIGLSATTSGLLLAPLMAGVVVASIVTGHVITATGRYRVWPILGTLLAAAGLFLLSTLSPDTSPAAAIGYVVLLGLGLGCLVQNMVVIVQNAVPRRDLGAATATAGLFRILGGAVGTGLLGAILGARLTAGVERYVPAGELPDDLPPAMLAQEPGRAADLSAAAQEGLASAFAEAFGVVFLVAAAVAVLALVAAVLLPEVPLRDLDDLAGDDDAPAPDTATAASPPG